MLLAIPDIELADAQINALNSLYAYGPEGAAVRNDYATTLYIYII